MPLEFYFDTTKTTKVATVMATWTYSGTNTYSISPEPATVILLKTSLPYSIKFTKVASGPTTYQYTYSSGTLTINNTNVSNGDVFLLLSAGNFIFETANTVAGKNYFVSNSSDANTRTKTQTIYLHNTEQYKQYVDITITPYQVLSGLLQTSWITLSTDGSTYSSSITILSINPGSYATVYVKAVMPQQGSGVSLSLRNITVKVDSYELSTL